MHALLVNVNFRTGERAGGINPKGNHALKVCWQDTEAGYEIRFVRDGNVEQYRGLEGIEVIESCEAMDAALAKLVTASETYQVYNPALMAASISTKAIRVQDIDPALSESDEAQVLYERGALGIQRVVQGVPTAAALCAQWGIEE